MFDNEYDLTLAIIAGMKARSSVVGYDIERFIFNYAYLLINQLEP